MYDEDPVVNGSEKWNTDPRCQRSIGCAIILITLDKFQIKASSMQPLARYSDLVIFVMKT